MLPRPFCAASLILLALSACSLPAPYETYPPSTPPPPPPKPPNALTVAGATTTTPDNEIDVGAPQTTSQPSVPSAPVSQSPPGKATPIRQVAICYNRLWNSAAVIRSSAQEACGSKTTPRVVSQDIDLSACPVLTPTHAVYACDPAH